MNGCKLFKCDGCSKYKKVEEQHIEKVAHTVHNHNSENELRYNISHVQLCNKCWREINNLEGDK
jgi:hypothetical protein